MAVLERKLLRHYVEWPALTEGGDATFEVVGKDNEEMNMELNPNVESSTNVLGENATFIDKYEPQMQVDPHRARSSTAAYAWLKDAIDKRKVLDDLKVRVVEVDMMEEPTTGAYPARIEDAIVEIPQYGGSGTFDIPYTLHMTGENKADGTFNPTTATWTPSA
jgi:hypothetical protein